ncbi:hypothetical protein [Sphingomonas flavescens]|uniref:hypothetical protein n=1 Tax=Sphingomonas flavescens TaxID=3132797 RepID=UPI0028054524|nr:hypothetical protein [Sphingomonas limnosediminicola]
MFRAVRLWWQSGRGKETSRLFVFELTVVMIGVLAAQQVSNWASNRSQMQEVEGLYRDQMRAFGVYRIIADTYAVAIPCYRERADDLFRIAASDQAADSAQLAFAPLAGMGPDDITTEQYRLLGSQYGESTRTKIGSMQFNLREVQDEVVELNRVWFDFQRLDGAGGKVSDADRAAARAAAVKVRALLARLAENTEVIQQLARQLGVPRKLNPGITPVSNCAEMWRTGLAFRDRDRPDR